MFKQEWAARARVLSLCAVMMAALVGCGGDGDSGPVPITISAQPSDQNAVDASAVTFTVAAAGDGITYQWQQSTDGGTTWTNIAGATSASYTINSVTTTLSGEKLRVVVAGTASTVTSSAVTLTVSAPTPAAITVQPTPQTATAGSNATFTVTSTGTAVTYQWQSSADGATWTDISGQTSATLTLASVALADNGKQIRVLARNSLGTVTSSAVVLTVQSAPASPVVSTQPVASSVVASGTATFSVVSSGTPTPTYQWQFSADNGVSYVDIAGATASSYTTAATTAADDGKLFRVTMTNSAGTVVSDAVRLTVAAAPVPVAISAQPVSASVAAPVTATFSVAATGSPAPTYQWQLSIDGGATFANITGATSASYTTPATATTDTGRQYRVVVTNSQGSVNSAAATLSVGAPQASSVRWFVAPVGVISESAGTTWKDVTRTQKTQALVAVSAASGNQALKLVAAGGRDDAQLVSVEEATVTATTVSNRHTRYVLFFKADGRLYSVDTHAIDPTPVQVSSVKSTDLCGAFSSAPRHVAVDYADASRSWLFYANAGPDGRCLNSDDELTAVRVGMASSEAPVVVTGSFQQAINGNNGALVGAVLRSKDGMQIQSAIASAGFQSPTKLFDVNATAYVNIGLTGAPAAGVWLFSDAGYIWAVDFAKSPLTKVQLIDASVGTPRVSQVYDGENIYVVNNLASGTGYFYKVNRQTLAVSPMTTLINVEGRPTDLIVTPNRLIARSVTDTGLTTSVYSIPKSNAPQWTVLSESIPFYNNTKVAMYASGENVWIDSVRITIPEVTVLASDGSSSTSMAKSTILAALHDPSGMPTASSVGVRQFIVLSGEGAGVFFTTGTHRGASLSLFDGASKSRTAVFGSFPADVDWLVSNKGLPFYVGQGGVVSYEYSQVSGFVADADNSDLYYLKSDTVGLVRVPAAVAAAATRIRSMGAIVKRN